MGKAEAKALKDALDRKLQLRPSRGRLEERGTIKDRDRQEELLAEREEAARVLEGKLGPTRPSADELKEKGILKDGRVVEVDDDAVDVAIAEIDWRSLSESIFFDLDLDHSETVEYDEVIEVLGGNGMTVLNGLMADESGTVGLGDWVAFMERLHANQGLEAVHTCLDYCQGKIDEYKQEKEYQALLKKQSRPAKSEEFAANAAIIEGKLERSPDRERLENRGVLKSKDEHEVQKMGRDHAQAMLEEQLGSRPAADEIKSADGFPMIKDLETHQEQQQQIGAATKLQAMTRGLLSLSLLAHF
jgi:hypothetical protein